MNIIRGFTWCGSPFHGLATNGVLSTTLQGNLSISQDGGTNQDLYGGSVYIEHPAAPAITRSTAQQSKDTAEGLEWRDYALLCGQDRSFNGIPGTELGNDQWLYCDALGGTWVIKMVATKATTTITFQIWLQAIFGRIGHSTRTFTPQLLGSLVWTPDIPSWYTAGAYDESDVVTAINLDWINTLAFSKDGAECYINIECNDTAINQDVYDEATPDGYASYYNFSSALVGVVKVVISGNGDLEDNGDGITAIVTEDLVYEGGVVTNRSVGGSGNASGFPCGYANVTVSPSAPADINDPCDGSPIVPDTIQEWVRTTSVALQSSPANVVLYQFRWTVILYRTPDGDVVRTFDISQEADYVAQVYGGYSETYWISSCAGVFDIPETDTNYFGSVGNGWYRTVAYVGAGTAIESKLTTTTTTTEKHTVSVCGVEIVDSDFSSVRVRVDISECENILDGVGGSYLPDNGLGAESDSTSATFNGSSTTGTNWYSRVQVRQLAQNLHYIVSYHSNVNDEGNHTMEEYHAGINWQGTASAVWSDSYDTYVGTTDPLDYRPASSAFPVIYPYQELVFSYQPKTGDHQHNQTYIFANYTGDTYQYV